MQNKKEIRGKIKDLFRHYTTEEMHTMSSIICSSLLELREIKESSVIAAFYPLFDEPDIMPVIKALCLSGKCVLLPEVISSEDMLWRCYHPFVELRSGALGTQYPESDIFHDLSLIDVVIVPGRAFSKNGGRVGRGRGYYDRFLAKVPDAVIIGVGFPFQMLDEVPMNVNDVHLDMVITA